MDDDMYFDGDGLRKYLERIPLPDLVADMRSRR